MPTSKLRGRRFQISISRRLLPALAQWFLACGGRRSGVTLTFFLSQIVEERLADFLKLRIKPSLDQTAVFKEIRNPCKPFNHLRKLNPEITQRIIFKHLGGMSDTAIARSEGLGATTIGRVTRAYEQQAHTRTDVGRCRTRKPTAESREFLIVNGGSCD